MSAIKVTLSHFSGTSKVFTTEETGLAAVIRGLAIDNARLAVQTTAVPDFVDNSTGVAAATVADVVVPKTVTNASASAIGSPKAALDTALNGIEDALSVLAENVNKGRTRLGLVAVTYSGTVTTSGTIPAVTKALAATSGASTATLKSARASIQAAKNGLARVLMATNEVLVAVGEAKIKSSLTFADLSALAVPNPAATVASATGADAASDTEVDAALTALANGIATVASKWNAAMSQASQPTTPLNVIAG